MQTLIGWGLLLLVIGGIGLVIRAAGPPGKARPHCGGDDTGSGGCH